MTPTTTDTTPRNEAVQPGSAVYVANQLRAIIDEHELDIAVWVKIGDDAIRCTTTQDPARALLTLDITLTEEVQVPAVKWNLASAMMYYSSFNSQYPYTALWKVLNPLVTDHYTLIEIDDTGDDMLRLYVYREGVCIRIDMPIPHRYPSGGESMDDYPLIQPSVHGTPYPDLVSEALDTIEKRRTGVLPGGVTRILKSMARHITHVDTHRYAVPWYSPPKTDFASMAVFISPENTDEWVRFIWLYIAPIDGSSNHYPLDPTEVDRYINRYLEFFRGQPTIYNPIHFLFATLPLYDWVLNSARYESTHVQYTFRRTESPLVELVLALPPLPPTAVNAKLPVL